MDDLFDPDLFDQVPCLAATPRTVASLPGGLTNRNYKVSTPEGTFVARVWAPGDLLAINRDHEHRNSVAAAAAGVGAPVVAYRPEHGLLVLGYIEGRTFDNEDLADPRNIPRVAEACRRLHAGPEVRRRLQHVRGPAALPGRGHRARVRHPGRVRRS